MRERNLTTDFDDEGQDLARWLQESGRRKVDHAPVARLKNEPSTRKSADLKQPRYITQPSSMSLLVVAALAYLQYIYIDVNLQIASMRPVTVFIFTDATRPPRA